MAHQTKKVLQITFTFLLIIGLGFISGLAWTKYHKNTVIFAFTKAPQIIAEAQKDSPLLISNLYVNSNALKPTFGYLLTNVSDKPIRAFTVRYEVFYGKNNIREATTHLTHFPSEKQLLRPYQSNQESNGGGSTYPEEVSRILLSVDFVEFDDGSEWGNDYSESSQIIAGQRAGALAAKKIFLERLENNNFESFQTQIEDIALNVIDRASYDKSSAWRNGFQSGVGIIRNRVQKAINNGGLNGAKKELQKPIDASEGRKE